MKKSILYILFASVIVIYGCSSEKSKEISSESASNEDIEMEAEREAEAESISGYATIDELTEEVITSIKNNDFNDYASHVMTKDMENTVSTEIKNAKMKDRFLDEFGFSIDREKERFDNLITFLANHKVDMSKINYDEIEVVDYKHDDFAPLHLKEVMIIVPHDYEMLLIYTALRINNRWYLTAELEM